jgi:ribonuclease VapC
MVIDTSAILAILLGEAEGRAFTRFIENDAVRLLSAASRIEASLVIESRKGNAGRIDLDRFIDVGAIEIVAVTAEQAEAACDAFRRYGKGRHPANLNFGDVFVYSLAKTTGEPLLFKGSDFIKTDLSFVTEGD